MTNPNLFNQVLVWPFVNVLLTIYQLISSLHVPYALGFSIIGLTIVIRFILYPLTHSQLKTSKKMQDLAPHISNLKEKHKNDTKRFQTEQMKLFKEHGVNPAAGCLPVIIQLPIIWGLYTVLQQVVKLSPKVAVVDLNKIAYFDFLKLRASWDPMFFGLPLGSTPAHLLPKVGILIMLVPVITGALQFIQSKMMFTPQKQDKNKPKKDDFASAFQSQSMYIFPIMIGFFSYTFFLGLSLYWNTFTIFGIVQQYKISGLGSLAEWKKKIIK